MERINYRITLDVHKGGVQKVLRGFISGDNLSRRICVSLNANGKTCLLGDGTLAVMYVTKENGVTNYGACDIVDNTVFYDVQFEDLDVAGVVEMQLKVLSNDMVLYSPLFSLEVQESSNSDTEAEASQHFTALERALIKAQTVYDTRLVSIEVREDMMFVATYADGTTYESDVFKGMLDVSRQEINKWLDEHPEATTTVQDNSLTADKFTEELKLKALKDYATPQMYGAKGDGVTDDTTAFQACLDNNMYVFVPNGTYILDFINVVSGHVIIGESKEHTILKEASGHSGGFVRTLKTDTDLRIENITFDGTDSTGGNCLSLYSARAILKNLIVHDFKGMGIWLKNDTLWGKHCELSDLILYDNVNGNLCYESSTDSNFYNILAYYNSDVPKPDFNILVNSHGCRFFGVHVWGRCFNAIITRGFKNCFTNCHLEGGDVKLKVYQQTYFDGLIYDADMFGGIGIQMVGDVRNSVFRGTFHDLQYVFDTQGHDKGSNVFEITHITNIPNNAILKDSLLYDEKSSWDVTNWDFSESEEGTMTFIKTFAHDTKDTVNNIYQEKMFDNKVFYDEVGKCFVIDRNPNHTAYPVLVSGAGYATLQAKSDTQENADVYIIPKGNGKVNFGTLIDGFGYPSISHGLSNGSNAPLQLAKVSTSTGAVDMNTCTNPRILYRFWDLGLVTANLPNEITDGEGEVEYHVVNGSYAVQTLKNVSDYSNYGNEYVRYHYYKTDTWYDWKVRRAEFL